MSLPTFYDYNPSNPWEVIGENHTIDSQGRIRLEYIPLKAIGSQAVTIAGYTETTSPSPGLTEFYIDYQESTAYRTAQGYVQFSLSAAANEVSVNYYGVSTVLWADTMNEIGNHISDNDVHVSTEDKSLWNSKGTGDMLAATYDPIIMAITGEATVGATPDTTLAALWALPWTEKFILNNPADAYVSPSLPLSRNGTMTTMDFYCTGTPASSTNIVVKQGSTTVGTAAISAAGKTTLTFSTAVTGTLDDLFSYTVGGAGLAACTVLCNQKWVNR